MDMTEARELINSPLWTGVRDHFLATGTFAVYPKGDLRRLEYLAPDLRRAIGLWREGLAKAEEWKKVVDGAKVRELEAGYPGVYPQIFRFLPYFAKFRAGGYAQDACVALLLKLRFPEAYALCFS